MSMAESGTGNRRPAARALLVALAAASVCAQTAFAQLDAGRDPRTAALAGYIHTVVRDSLVRPIADAEVIDLATRRSARTNDDGLYRLEGVPVGWRLLSVRRLGFQTFTTGVQVAPYETTDLDVRLTRAPMTLDTVRVLARGVARDRAPAAFARRASMGMGYFITRDEIVSAQAVTAGDLLIRVPAMRLDRVTGELFSVRATYRALGGERCQRMSVLMDGMPINGVDGRAFDIRDIPAEVVVGVEVYASPATVPPELRTILGAACGLVAIWTRQ